MEVVERADDIFAVGVLPLELMIRLRMKKSLILNLLDLLSGFVLWVRQVGEWIITTT